MFFLGAVEVYELLELFLILQHPLTLGHVEVVVGETDKRTNQSVVTSL